MTFVDHRYLESGKFKHKGRFSVIEQNITSTGKVMDRSSLDYDRFFAFVPDTGLSRGLNSDAHVEQDTGLKIVESDLEIIVKYSETLHTAFRERKKIEVTWKNEKYSIVSAVDVGGEAVYLSLGLKRVVTNA